MSIDIMNRLWWREDLGMTEKFVAVALADTASDDGVCWPAVKTLALKCGCSERTVQTALAKLAATGLLRRQPRLDKSSFYIFNLDLLPHIERPARNPKEVSPMAHLTDSEAETDMFGPGADSAPPWCRSRTPLVQNLHPPGADLAPRTLIEPSIEPSERLHSDFEGSNSLEASRPNADLIEFVQTRWGEIKAANPNIRGIRKIDDGLRHTIIQRAKQHARPGESLQAVWAEALDNIAASRFLRGMVPPGPGRDESFTLSLGWATKAANFREIIQGKYNGTRDAGSFDPATGRRIGPAEQAARESFQRLRAGRTGGGGGGNPGVGTAVHPG